MIIKGICHVHSRYSYDGTLDLDELMNIYAKKGFNFMLLTEHAEKGMSETRYDQIKNECKRLSKNKFILIPGLEYISYQSYHILAIGLNHYKDLNGKDTIYILEEIKKSGGISIVAHPVRCGHRISKEILPFVDGIEIWNTSYDRITQVKKNIALFKSSRRYNPNLVGIGGMDLHLYDTKENIVYFYMPSVPHLSKDEIISSLKKGKFEVRSDIYSISSTGNISVQNRKRFLVKSSSNMYKKLLKSIVYVLMKTKTKKVFDVIFSSQIVITTPKMENIQSAKILILAPHPDDDVIGCGGAIRKHIKNNSKVKVVYMTDGRRSAQNIPINELIHIRKEEAKNALDVLGCYDPTFLNYPDRKLKCNTESINRITNILNEYQPQSIYVPFFTDNHPDHVVTTKIVAKALERYPHDLNCYNYEIWAPLHPNILVDISDVIDEKIDAIKAHKTQLKIVNYAEKIRGLNAYRSMTAGRGVRYCEAFYKCSRKDQINIAKKLKMI